MHEAPSRWAWLTTLAVLLLFGAWAVYEYRQDPGKIPFEPIIAVVASVFTLWGFFLRKKKPQEPEPPTTYQAVEKTGSPAAQGQAGNTTTVQASHNPIVQSTLTAQTIHVGDNIQYNGQKIPRHLTSTPFLPEIFLGRETELQAIHDKLFSPDHNILLLVNGEGGVGKTSLASRYYRLFESEYAHLAWVLSERSIANALLLLAQPMGLTFDEKADTAQRFQLLLQALCNLEKPCLLVIDNANELDDLEANYPQLRQLPNFHLLLTTRITGFGQAATHRIEGLPEAEALELFQRYYPQFQPESEAGVFKAIREAVGGNTLVVELLAKNLAQLNTGLKTRYALPDLLQDLQEKGLLQLSQTQAVRTDYQKLNHADPKDIIAAMYDLGELPPEEVALLCVFAVLPAESIGFETLARLLPELKDLDKLLLSLAQKGWIENKDVTDFKCSPVVQEVVKAKREDLLGDCRGLLDALVRELVREILHEENYKHSTIFARYAETLVAALNSSDDDLATLCQNLGNFHSDTGDLGKAMQVYERMEKIQASLLEKSPDNPDFKNGLAISYTKLGETHSALGNLDKALTFFEERSRLGEELYQSYPQNVSFKNGLAISYSKLGSTHSALGNLDKALTFFEQDIELSKELYQSFPQNVAFKKGLAVAHQKLGSTHSALGNLDKALTFFEEMSRFAKELYQSYTQNVDFKNGLAISYEKLGETHSALGNLDKALTFFEDETTLFEELYESYPQNVSFKNGLAISYQKLGDTHSALGNLDKALTFFEQYNLLEKELYQSYPQNVSFKNSLAISYSKLGDTHSALGNLDKALTFFEQYNLLEKELYQSYPQNVSFKNGLAISYAKLAQFNRDNFKDKERARAYFQQAENLWQELVRDAPQYVQFQRFLGMVKRELAALG